MAGLKLDKYSAMFIYCYVLSNLIDGFNRRYFSFKVYFKLYTILVKCCNITC